MIFCYTLYLIPIYLIHANTNRYIILHNFDHNSLFTECKSTIKNKLFETRNEIILKAKLYHSLYKKSPNINYLHDLIHIISNKIINDTIKIFTDVYLRQYTNSCDCCIVDDVYNILNLSEIVLITREYINFNDFLEYEIIVAACDRILDFVIIYITKKCFESKNLYYRIVINKIRTKRCNRKKLKVLNVLNDCNINTVELIYLHINNFKDYITESFAILNALNFINLKSALIYNFVCYNKIYTDTLTYIIDKTFKSYSIKYNKINIENIPYQLKKNLKKYTNCERHLMTSKKLKILTEFFAYKKNYYGIKYMDYTFFKPLNKNEAFNKIVNNLTQNKFEIAHICYYENKLCNQFLELIYRYYTRNIR